jgi:hypothetical protein
MFRLALFASASLALPLASSAYPTQVYDFSQRGGSQYNQNVFLDSCKIDGHRAQCTTLWQSVIPGGFSAVPWLWSVAHAALVTLQYSASNDANVVVAIDLDTGAAKNITYLASSGIPEKMLPGAFRPIGFSALGAGVLEMIVARPNCGALTAFVVRVSSGGATTTAAQIDLPPGPSMCGINSCAVVGGAWWCSASSFNNRNPGVFAFAVPAARAQPPTSPLPVVKPTFYNMTDAALAPSGQMQVVNSRLVSVCSRPGGYDSTLCRSESTEVPSFIALDGSVAQHPCGPNDLSTAIFNDAGFLLEACLAGTNTTLSVVDVGTDTPLAGVRGVALANGSKYANYFLSA